MVRWPILYALKHRDSCRARVLDRGSTKPGRLASGVLAWLGNGAQCHVRQSTIKKVHFENARPRPLADVLVGHSHWQDLNAEIDERNSACVEPWPGH